MIKETIAVRGMGDTFVTVPVIHRSEHIAVTPFIRDNKPTRAYIISHVATGYMVTTNPLRSRAIAIKLHDDIVAQCPAEDMQTREWPKKHSWETRRILEHAALKEDREARVKPKTIREKAKTPRLDKNGQIDKRWWKLLPFDVPRWIRCYNNPESGDRYTVLFSGLKSRIHPYVGMSAHPFHPQGIGQHGESDRVPIDYPTYGHLGKKIVFADLPKDCQALVLGDYCDYWHLDAAMHPAWEAGRGFVNSSSTWRPMRPFPGQFDSRQEIRYADERRLLSDDECLHDAILIAGALPEQDVPSLDAIADWDWADRRDVYIWAMYTHLAASDNPVRIPDLPDVLNVLVKEHAHV